MATSGAFLTSDSGQGDSLYYGRLRFSWSRTSWGRSGSVGYHNISYWLKTYGGQSNYWQYLYNRSMNVDGSGYSGGTLQAYGNGATTALSGSKTLYTNSSGDRSFSASAQGGIYLNTINTSGSGSWSLDNIPMLPVISSTTGTQNDESNNIKINYSNPAGGSVTANLYVRPYGSSGSYNNFATRTGYSSGQQFNLTEAERNSARGTLAGTTKGQLLYRVANSIGYDTSGYSNNIQLNIVNANPTFTTASYKDSNSATVAITGDDQYMIQNKSTLEAKILQADQAVPLKSATMVEYNFKIGSIDTDVAFADADIVPALGTLGINSTADLVVKAIDSRGLSTSVNLPVAVLPYASPLLSVSAQRLNNFESDTTLTISATISPLTIASVDKNDVNATSGVRYRYKKTSDGAFGSWINVASTTSGGNVSTTPFDVTLDRTFAWNVEVEITDKLETVTQALIVPVGEPIFRIGLDGGVYNNEKRITVMGDEIRFTSSGIYSKPKHLQYIVVEVQAGGGGSGVSGSTVASESSEGGSGGGGEYARGKILASELDDETTVTVGAGGVGTTSSETRAGTGGTSSFGDHITALGGEGGLYMAGTAGSIYNPSANGGSGGTGGDLRIRGGNSGHSAVGGGSTFGYGRMNFGGASYLGASRASAGTATSGSSVAGANYGGGAVGGRRGSSSAKENGANGGQGIVIIHEYF